MAITEVFPNPTVKQVIFQITFPNLFYLESKVGDLQIAIMESFPETKMAYRRFLFGELGPDVKPEDLPKLEKSTPIWQFYTPSREVTLSVTSNSLDMVSTAHKTYNQGDTNKFRDIIEFVLNAFLKLVSIPIVNRIGLRYRDECPLPSKDSETLKSYYNSVFPTNRFAVEDASDMLFKVTIDKNDHYITYIENLRKVGNSYKLVLDFDGFATKVTSGDCMTVLDKLHDSISNEFEKTIKQPVYEYMRKKGE